MDEIDRAQAQQEQALAINLQRRRPPPTIAPRGYCHNPYCEEEFEPNSPKLFCGEHCSKKYEAAKRCGHA